MTVVTTNHRDRLADIRERTSGARKRMATAREALRLAGDDAQVRQAAEAQLDAARNDEQMAMQLENSLLRQISGTSGMGPIGFLDDPTTVSLLERLASSTMPMGQVPLGPLESAEQLASRIQSGNWGPRSYAASTVNNTDAGRTVPFTEGPGVLPQLRRRIRLLDLIPTRVMDGNVIPYVIESGSLDTAAETAEGSVKPAGDVALTDAEAKAQTIANWIKSPRQVLADVPGLSAELSSRLTYTVLRRLEAQVLAGDGTGANLTGILHSTGIGSVTYSATEALSDLTLDGITATFLSDAEPDAVVVHPTDMATMLKKLASGSGERLDSEGAFTTPPSQIWGLPAIVTRVMPQGQLLVASFAQGAILWIREGVHVVVGMESDDMVRNLVTLLGECRAALTVIQPTAFCLVHLA